MSEDRICKNCKSSLSEANSVVREYADKDGGESIFAEGHYDEEGCFDNDSFDGFGDGRYDCLDDSDSCSTCDSGL